jgi:hypothetical protein
MAAARHLLFSLVSAISVGVGRRALFQDKSHCKEIYIGAFLLPFLNHFPSHQPSTTSHRTSDIRHDTTSPVYTYLPKSSWLCYLTYSGISGLASAAL